MNRTEIAMACRVVCGLARIRRPWFVFGRPR